MKDEAKRLVDHLQEDASRNDLMYPIYLRQRIAAGLRDVVAGRVVDLKEVRFDSVSHLVALLQAFNRKLRDISRASTPTAVRCVKAAASLLWELITSTNRRRALGR